MENKLVTDSSYFYEYSVEHTTKYVTPTTKIAVSLLICVLGLIGNLVVISIILTLREYKKSTAPWYVLQLAIADSLFLLTLPFQVVEDLKGKWIFPEWLCKMKETILFLNYYASIIFLMIMTIDRYVAICHPIKSKLYKAPTLLVTLITWSVSLLICVPVMLYSSKTDSSQNCICAFLDKIPQNFTEICIFENLTKEDCDEVTMAGQKNSCSASVPVKTFTNKTEYEAYNSTYDIIEFSGSDSLYDDTNYLVDNFHNNQTNITFMYALEDPKITCSYDDHGNGFKGFIIFNSVAMFIIPFVIMTSCYTAIIIQLTRGIKMTKDSRVHNKSSRKRRSERHSNTSHSNYSNQHCNSANNNYGNHHVNQRNHNDNKRRKSSTTTDKDLTRITVMFIALVVVFGLCWIPFHGFHIARIVGFSLPPDSTFCETFPVIATLLGYSNSAINPFLYTFMLKNFVKRLRETSKVIRFSTKTSRQISAMGLPRL